MSKEIAPDLLEITIFEQLTENTPTNIHVHRDSEDSARKKVYESKQYKGDYVQVVNDKIKVHSTYYFLAICNNSISPQVV